MKLNKNVRDYLSGKVLTVQLAVDIGDIEIVRRLLQYPGLDVNNINALGETALQLALEIGDIEILGMLLQHPDLDVNNIKGWIDIASKLAMKIDGIKILSMLLQHPDLDVNKINELGDIALQVTVAIGDIKRSNMLLFSADNNFSSENVIKAFTQAVKESANTMVLTFLINGVSPFLLGKNLVSAEPTILSMIQAAQSIWRDVLDNKDMSSYALQAKDPLIKPMLNGLLFRVSLKQFFYPRSLSAEQKLLIAQDNKIEFLSRKLNAVFLQSLSGEVCKEILRFLGPGGGDIPKLYVALQYIKPIKLLQNAAHNEAREEGAEPIKHPSSLLYQNSLYFSGSLVSRPFAKCTESYFVNSYKGLTDQPYLECLQQGYLSTAGLLENVLVPFLMIGSSLLLNVCGWPVIAGQGYEFKIQATSYVLQQVGFEATPVLWQGMLSELIAVPLPFIGEIIYDGLKYLGATTYCSVIDCAYIMPNSD